MKYNVYVSVDLSGVVEVEADSLDEAEEKALATYDIEELDIDSVHVEAKE
jgi:hypothetical protein